MTLTAHGWDLALLIFACIAFIVAVPVAYLGHRAALSIVALGLLLVTATLIFH